MTTTPTPTAAIDATHDPALQSWVTSANAPDTDFPIQNLPFGRFRRVGRPGDAWRAGVAIGSEVLDLAAARDAMHWPADLQPALAVLAAGDLNAFVAMGAAVRRGLRAALSQALAHTPGAGGPQDALAACLVPQAEAELGLPCRIGDYTDFYVGIHHATAVGKLFRPDNPLLPNYKWVPIGYHGRASTIVPSGVPFRRPRGQLSPPGAAQPVLAPCQRLDFELELGIVIGPGNAMGTPVALDDAEDHVVGLTLFNDWSARDIQAWEYQPLGPFLSKSFASTLSPWVVTLEALAPFRRPFERAAGEPQPLPYLDSAANRAGGAFDIGLEVLLQTQAMREAGLPAERISRSNFADAAYWTVAQLVAHHTVNGCALAPGDLFGSGTLSLTGAGQAGSLLELSQGGRQPITLANGEQRTFLQDGDSLRLAGRCAKPGFRAIGFGPCEAVVLPAPG
ncbi:MAG TPA: fumarylacetoacetase [Aquabacterium sp.]|nr:fumarylacetoacetase [Aquabacterium sp.]HQC98345.1 fumarylacetoacetase [Aquabacterium sp.]